MHDGRDSVVVFDAAAAHDRKLTVLRALFAAGNGRIDKSETCILRCGRKHAGNARRSSRMVDKHAALAHGLECALRSARHLRHIGVAPHTGEHDIGVSGGIGRRAGGAPAMLLHPALGFLARTIEDSDIVSGHRKMTGHRVAHDS